MKKKDRVRKDQFRMNLLPEERAMLEKNALEFGLTKSDYLRSLIMYGAVVGRQFTMDEAQGKAILYELNRIGNNINQIAYNTNAKSYTTYKDMMELKKDYFELLAVLGKIPYVDKEVKDEWQQQISILLRKQLNKR